ncbi:MAG: aminotransferase class V-fold PLP-dependent enzyme [Halodesulfurarchaeum sp.]
MNPETLREQIPGLAETVYLNHGASGPSPRRVVEAARTSLESQEFDAPGAEGMYRNAMREFGRTRQTVAEFIGADRGDVALTESTTDGINRVATALDWDPGDRVLTTDVEHSAGKLPWRLLEERFGVEVTVVETEGGRIEPRALESAADGASLVCFSALDWLYGRRQPVEALVEAAHDVGALVLVDAVQVVGQRPLDVTAWDADFVAASGHKWLLGPWGSGFLYVDPEVADRTTPAHVGFRGVADPTASEISFKSGARRFEVGTISPAPYAGLREAIDVATSVGMDTITGRIEALTDHFKERVPADRLLSPAEYHSGLVTVRVSEPEETVERLEERDVVIRSLPLPEAVRVSIHAVNTREEIERAAEALFSE